MHTNALVSVGCLKIYGSLLPSVAVNKERKTEGKRSQLCCTFYRLRSPFARLIPPLPPTPLGESAGGEEIIQDVGKGFDEVPTLPKAPFCGSRGGSSFAHASHRRDARLIERPNGQRIVETPLGKYTGAWGSGAMMVGN